MDGPDTGDQGNQVLLEEDKTLKECTLSQEVETRDGILGHQFNKRLESFAPCYSQSLLLSDFKENHTILWF
jgi:hypothetical protein